MSSENGINTTFCINSAKIASRDIKDGVNNKNKFSQKILAKL